MLDVDEFMHSVLQHELPYDPVKAHEYYLKTRELKGRRSVSQLKGKKKKENWAYAKHLTDEQHKAQVKAAAEAQKAAVKRLQLSGQKQRLLIAARIKELLAQNSNTAKARQEKVKNEAKAKIDAIPPVPEGLSKEETARLTFKRNEEIAKLRGEANDKLKAIAKETQSSRKETSTSISSERKGLSLDIKKSLDTSRKKYISDKEALKKKYQAELDAQFNTIKGSVPQRSKG